MRTTFPAENGEIDSQRTNPAQNQPDSESEKCVRFPKTILNKKTKAKAVIYAKKPDYPWYRVAWSTNGKRQMQSFAVYADALNAAKDRVKQLDRCLL